MRNYNTTTHVNSQGNSRKHRRTGESSHSKKPSDRDSQEAPRENLSGAVPGAVEDNRSNFALPIWEYLVEYVGFEGEVKQSKIASKLGCSVSTVKRILNDFERCDLVEWESYNGQGRGIKLKNLWLQRGKEIANKLTWKKGFEAEDEYLRTQWTRQGQLGSSPLDCIRNFEKAKDFTKDQHLDVDSSPKFITNQNLTPRERRSQWLDQFPDSEKLSSREGFQAVLMEKLRIFLEGEDLDPKAVKATTDSFWLRVKRGTLGQARKALSELKSKAEDLISEIRDEFADRAKDAYRIANRFICFHILKDDTSEETVDFEGIPGGDCKRPESSRASDGKQPGRATAESYGGKRTKKESRWRLQKERRPSDWKFTGLETVSNLLGDKPEGEDDSTPSARERKAVKIAKTYGAKAAAKRTGLSKNKVEKLLTRSSDCSSERI